MTQKTYNQYCPVAHALDLIGDRWAVLIVRNLFTGPKRFSDLQRGLPGLSTNILTVRLKALEECGLIQTRYLPPPAASSVYELTEYGLGLEEVLVALARWGGQSLGEPQPGQIISEESVMLLAYQFIKVSVSAEHAAVYVVEIDDELYHGRVAVQVQGGEFTVQQEIPPAFNLKLHANLSTIKSIATGQITFKRAYADGGVTVEGSEDEIAGLLAHAEKGNEAFYSKS